jgi:hypothetical protein
MLNCDKLWQIVADFPFLSRVWDHEYVSEDCQNGFQQPWLNRLAEDPDAEIRTELEKLDTYLGTINSCPGFQKLRPGLRARGIEQFSSTLAEVKTDAWIANSNTLVEIRPPLPASSDEGDFMLNVAGNAVYGEVWQPRVLPSSWIVKGEIPIALTDQQTEAPKRIRTLLQKGNSQLPLSLIGIWVAHVYHAILVRSWIDFFTNDMANRANVLGVALWVRAGSNRLQSECVPCRGLANEGHEIYWLDNTSCKNTYLQRKFLCSLID